jgi:hypothetical protein
LREGRVEKLQSIGFDLSKQKWWKYIATDQC